MAKATKTLKPNKDFFLRKYKHFEFFEVNNELMIFDAEDKLVQTLQVNGEGTEKVNKAIEQGKQWVDIKLNPEAAAAPKKDEKQADQQQPPKEKGPMEIQKVKLRDNIFLTLDFIQNETDNKTRHQGEMNYGWPVHDDLKAKLETFRVHMVMILGYVDEKKIKVPITEFTSPIIDSFKVTQVTAGGAGEGVTITGIRTVYKRSCPLNAPFTKFYEEGDGYNFGADLQIAWDDLINECLLYISGKHGVGKQTELDFEGAKKKKKGKDAKNINEAETSEHVNLAQ